MRIVVGGRIPGYAAHADKMTAREYIEKVMNKTLFDPVLTTQLSNGFVPETAHPRLPDRRRRIARAMPRFWNGPISTMFPIRGSGFVPVAPVRVCVVQYQMRHDVRASRRLPSSASISSTSPSEYKCDFIVFPEIFTTQLLSLVKADNPAAADAQAVGVHAALSRAVHPAGGQVQRQHHRRLAFHAGGGQTCTTSPICSAATARSASNTSCTSRPASGTGGASRGAIASRCSTPTRARSPSRSATTSSSRS